MIRDEFGFAAQLGPEVTAKVDLIAKAMCNQVGLEDGETPCTCGSDGGTCGAFFLYGKLAHAALLAIQQ